MNSKRPAPKRPIPDDADKAFSGIIYDVYHYPQKLYDGKTVTFEQLRRKDSVNVIPITPDGKIVLAKQEQPGLAPFIGTFSGMVDSGESPDQTAHRELREEAGLTTDDLVLWDVSQVLEKIDWAIWTFVARDCKKTDQQLDGGEKIEAFEVTFEEFMDIVAQDNYRDPEIALKILRLHKRGELDQLKKEWFS